jgi:superfamily II DNA or RNA helicase
MKIINHLQEINQKLVIIGLTGTPFRLSGNLTKLIYGKDKLFKSIVDRVSIIDLLNHEPKMLTEPVVPVDKNIQYNTKTIKGMMSDEEIDAEMHQDSKINDSMIVRDFLLRTFNRKKILIFSQTLKHAKNIILEMDKLGEDCLYVSSELSNHDRKKVLKRFHENDNCRFLVNKNILTTGYDESQVDCIVIVRKSASKALIRQIIGSGLRLHENKNDCLVLDYVDNFNDLNELMHNKGIENEEAESVNETQDCPACGQEWPITKRLCDCGYWFNFKECPICETKNSITSIKCSCCNHIFNESRDGTSHLKDRLSGANYYFAITDKIKLEKYVKNKTCLKVTETVIARKIYKNESDAVKMNYESITDMSLSINLTPIYLSEGSYYFKEFVKDKFRRLDIKSLPKTVDECLAEKWAVTKTKDQFKIKLFHDKKYGETIVRVENEK